MNIIRNVIGKLTPDFSADEARAIAIALCEHVTGYTRAQLLSDSTLVFTPEQQQKITISVNRMKEHEPLQYVLGESEFYGLIFKVDKRVLIPRPETEELVEWIINDLQGTSCTVIDFCTGSGCIAIALAKNLPDAEVMACDLSAAALEVASENGALNEVDVHFFQADVLAASFAANMSPIDVIVSNPPYVLENEKSSMQPNVLDYEPSMALFVPDANPLLFYEAIGKIAIDKLKPEGALYVEINRAMGKETVEMFRRMGFGFVELRNDLFGNARMVKAVKN